MLTNILKTVFLKDFIHAYMHDIHMSVTRMWMPRDHKRGQIHAAKGTGGCELPDVGAWNQTQSLCWSSKHS